tara:strand:- start:509 stop:709 length:201 start_codon:yes stop_codon:yes gene_type:complete
MKRFFNSKFLPSLNYNPFAVKKLVDALDNLIRYEISIRYTEDMKAKTQLKQVRVKFFKSGAELPTL